MPKNFNIRKADNADIVKLAEYYRELYKGDEEQKFFWSELDLNGFRANQTILVAEHDNKVVGYIWFVWYEHIREKGVAYFEELYVENKYRTLGIGKALVTYALGLIKEKGIRTVYCAVGRHMKDAQEFYKHIGFGSSHELWFEKEL